MMHQPKESFGLRSPDLKLAPLCFLEPKLPREESLLEDDWRPGDIQRLHRPSILLPVAARAVGSQ